jgi:hypothetical protein
VAEVFTSCADPQLGVPRVSRFSRHGNSDCRNRRDCNFKCGSGTSGAAHRFPGLEKRETWGTPIWNSANRKQRGDPGHRHLSVVEGSRAVRDRDSAALSEIFMEVCASVEERPFRAACRVASDECLQARWSCWGGLAGGRGLHIVCRSSTGGAPRLALFETWGFSSGAWPGSPTEAGRAGPPVCMRVRAQRVFNLRNGQAVTEEHDLAAFILSGCTIWQRVHELTASTICGSDLRMVVVGDYPVSSQPGAPGLRAVFCRRYPRMGVPHVSRVSRRGHHCGWVPHSSLFCDEW